MVDNFQEMAFRYSIRFSGAGSQGLIQAARIVAEAAAIYGDRNAAESCSYGPEARGSASKAEVVISDETIDYPKVETVDFLMALTQDAYDKYVRDVVAGGTVVTDWSVDTSKRNDTLKSFSVPFVDIAQQACSRSNMASIVALGFFAQVNEIVDSKAIRLAILARIPKRSEDVYMKAFEAGVAAALTPTR